MFTTFLREQEKIYNAAILAENGIIKTIYKKIHLFDAFGYKESRLFSSGNKLAISTIKGFKVGLAVCFDLRFPELFRIMKYRGVNLFIVPSAWYKGENKINQWRTLTLARAHENGSFLVGVNQTNPLYIGHSIVASPFASAIKELHQEPANLIIELQYQTIKKYESLLPIQELSKPNLYRTFLKPNEH